MVKGIHSKTKERVKSGIAHTIFVALVLFGLLYIVDEPMNSPTGHAVADPATSKDLLQSALTSSSMMNRLTQSKICVIINDPETPISLEAVKGTDGWEVSQMVGYCSGMTNEDLVIQFPDYDSFSNIVMDPSPRNIANGAKTRSFEILPSRFVESGGNVVCDAGFKVKYCDAVKTMSTPEDMIEADLVCCVDSMTKQQKKLLEQHLENTRYRDEIGILEQTRDSGFTMIISIAGLAVVLIVVILIVFMVVSKNKKPDVKIAASSQGVTSAVSPTSSGMVGVAVQNEQNIGSNFNSNTPSPQEIQLKDYAKQALLQGYSYTDLKDHFTDIGWDPQVADRIIRQAYDEASKN